jgi:hypothetical protein
MIIQDVVDINLEFIKDLSSFLSKIKENEVLNIYFIYKMQLRYLKQLPNNKKTKAIIYNTEFVLKSIKKYCDKKNYIVLEVK